MRVRTMLTFAAGAAAGAGATYLLDPEAGQFRRREFRRDALSQAKDTTVAVGKGGATLTADLARSAVDGYRQARLDAAGERPPT
ncbi:MAG: hypothetical protein R6U94_06640 [Nitriliruptoraceae bacterium]